MEKPESYSATLESETDLKFSIDDRVAIAIAVGNYLRALELFEQAERDFHDSCAKMRNVLKFEGRFVCNSNHQMHLITTDGDGSFSVEKIEAV